MMDVRSGIIDYMQEPVAWLLVWRLVDWPLLCFIIWQLTLHERTCSRCANAVTHDTITSKRPKAPWRWEGF